MTIDKQVCPLKQAKKLKELGIKQESYFLWVLRGGEWEIWDQTQKSDYETGREKEFISAFTSSEIGMLLPEDMECVRCSGKKELKKGKWMAFQTLDGIEPAYGETEVEARANLLLRILNKS